MIKILIALALAFWIGRAVYRTWQKLSEKKAEPILPGGLLVKPGDRRTAKRALPAPFKPHVPICDITVHTDAQTVAAGRKTFDARDISIDALLDDYPYKKYTASDPQAVLTALQSKDADTARRGIWLAKEVSLNAQIISALQAALDRRDELGLIDELVVLAYVLLQRTGDVQYSRQLLDFFEPDSGSRTMQSDGLSVALDAVDTDVASAYADKLVDRWIEDPDDQPQWLLYRVAPYVSDRHRELFENQLDDADLVPYPVALEYLASHRPDEARKTIIRLLEEQRVVSEQLHTLICSYFAEGERDDLFEALLTKIASSSGYETTLLIDTLMIMGEPDKTREALRALLSEMETGLPMSANALWRLSGHTLDKAIDDFVAAGLMQAPDDALVATRKLDADYYYPNRNRQGQLNIARLFFQLLDEMRFVQRFEGHKPNTNHEQFMAYALRTGCPDLDIEGVWQTDGTDDQPGTLNWLVNERWYSTLTPVSGPYFDSDWAVTVANKAFSMLQSTNRCIVVPQDDWTVIWTGDPEVLCPLMRKYHVAEIDPSDEVTFLFAKREPVSLDTFEKLSD